MTRFTATILVLCATVIVDAQAPSERDVLARIQTEGMQRSQAAPVFDMLTVNIGPRLTLR